MNVPLEPYEQSAVFGIRLKEPDLLTPIEFRALRFHLAPRELAMVKLETMYAYDGDFLFPSIRPVGTKRARSRTGRRLGKADRVVELQAWPRISVP